MKLTKLQRHTAYLIMLNECETAYEEMCSGWGFCMLVDILFGINIYRHNQGSFNEFLPELYSKRPDHNGIDWFNYSDTGWAERKKLLKQCIQETY